MRENGLSDPTRVGAARGPRARDGTIIPETIGTMWDTDLTATWTDAGQAAMLVALDHRLAERVGIRAAPLATRFAALEPVRPGVRRRFGGVAGDSARGPAMRHDHGSSYMSDHSQKELAVLGTDSPPAFVRSPEGNGCAGRFIRRLEENLLRVRTFGTIDELRQAMLAFRETDNDTWLIERHGSFSLAECRRRHLKSRALAA